MILVRMGWMWWLNCGLWMSRQGVGSVDSLLYFVLNIQIIWKTSRPCAVCLLNLYRINWAR